MELGQEGGRGGWTKKKEGVGMISELVHIEKEN